MEKDRNDFIKAVQLHLINVVDSDTVSAIVDAISYELKDYDIVKKTTEIVVYDDDNNKILKSFLSCLIVEGKSKKTINQYKCSIKRLFDFCGNKRYDKITAFDIRAWLAKCKLGGVKNVTLCNLKNYITPFFAWMFNEGMIEKNPCSTIRPIKVPIEEKEAFSSVEIDTIRSNCANDFERALIEFLYASGMRIEEVSDVKLENIDFNALVVNVKGGKGDKDRTTFINPVARKYITKYLESNKHTSEYLFTSRLGDKYTACGLRRVTTKLTKRCGFRVHPHRFRRTLASDLAKKGMQIQEIQKLLGHTSIETTKKYIDTRMEKVEASYRQYVA